MTTPYPLAGQRALAEVVSPGPWNAVTFTNAWANSGGGSINGQYRLVPLLNRVEVVGYISHAAIAGTSSPFTLPAGFLPATTQTFGLGFYACTAGFANAASPPLVQVQTSGLVSLQGLPAGTTLVQIGISYSLDA